MRGEDRPETEGGGRGHREESGLSTQRGLPGGGRAFPELLLRGEGGEDSDDHPSRSQERVGRNPEGNFS